MKLNPKLEYFIENKIEDNRDNRYILFEETDTENIRNLIYSIIKDKEIADELFETRTHQWEGKIMRGVPFKVLEDVTKSLVYRKRSTGYKKVMIARDKYFPNYKKLAIANRTGELIKEFHSIQNAIDLNLNKLFGKSVLEQN